jgi:NAD(P)-dependent dehydrogenase (short-subunit alcohol dehydrogenase family)
VRRLADAARATVDRLDLLINNAGIGTAGITLPKSIGCCPADETFTMRAGALFLISGNSSNVSRKPAR